MDAELLKGFIEESLSYLPQIGECVSAFSVDSSQAHRLKLAKSHAQTVKGAASMIGLADIAELSAEIENGIIALETTDAGHVYKNAETILQHVKELHEVLTFTSENLADLATAENGFNTDILTDFESEELEIELPEESEEVSEESSEDFEIDEEMLEVFALEADDHFQNISAKLSILDDKPNDRDALLEIRRSAHTLKGSAGIVGFSKLSALAHRVEDLLDYVAENEIESNKSIFELLLSSTDCMQALITGQTSSRVEKKLAAIYVKFDEIMVSLQETETEQVSAVSEIELVENSVSQEAIAQTFSAVDSVESAETAENHTPVHAEQRSVVRVSLERLDDLVKLVSEMVIGRSVFEQRLIELEQQIQELNHTTARLRRSTGKLEVDFEASALGKHTARPAHSGHRYSSGPSVLSSSIQEFDTLEFDQYTEFHQTTRELIEATSDTSAIHNDIDNVFLNLSLLFDSQRHLIEEMQDSLLRLRMVPLNSLSSRLHRTVRVTAMDEQKQAELVIENELIEIDTQILDTFVEPLIHLLRNAVAHGIEPTETRRLLGKPEKGRITLRAYSEGTHIVFVISDDGRGISVADLKKKAVQVGFVSPEEARTMSDDEALSLIFLPGLSTSAEINQVSGRGVGMNIVQSVISRRHGNIFISSDLQKGTTFTVRLPMALAVTRALLVKAATQTFAFPLKLIRQVVEVSPADLAKAMKEKTFRHENKPYSFFHFNSLLNLPVSEPRSNAKISLLLIETPDKPCALMVDELIKPEEIVIKPLGSLLNNVPEIIGATTLGNGTIVPVLDLIYLFKKKPAKNQKPKAAAATKAEVTVLVVDDSPSVRQMNSNLIRNLGWQPILAKDGIEALEVLHTFHEKPDIILTDVEMPRMDGYELLASLRRHETLSNIPVIMITSRSGDKHRRKAFDLGVSEYLSKPFEESVLINKMKEFL